MLPSPPAITWKLINAHCWYDSALQMLTAFLKHAFGDNSMEIIPSGTYTLNVSSPDRKTISTQVTVSAGQILAPRPSA
jgi:hypothetical protein